MAHQACTELLQWALPKMGMRWRGFRRVRRQVCRRIEARRRELGLGDLTAYRACLEGEPDGDEWLRLDAMCRVTISRFYRNHRIFDAMPRLLEVLADQAASADRTALRVWSAGCASGEEPYSVSIASEGAALAGLPLEIVASDADPQMIERARRARYAPGTLRELSEAQRAAAFEQRGDRFVIASRHRARVRFLVQDVRHACPPGRFDMVLCRNLAFTYFDPPTQTAVAARLSVAMVPGGALVVGAHESPPGPFAPWPGIDHVYRRPVDRRRALPHA